MNKIVTFDLSEKGIVNAKKEIKNIIKAINKEVNTEFVSMCLDWIQNRAIQYLETSGLDSDMINALRENFVKKVFVNAGHLVVSHPQGAYIEFGVGQVGLQEPYPKAEFNQEINWEYDMDSDAKYPLSRRWTFVIKSNEPLDMLPQNAKLYKEKDNGNKVYISQGSQGVLFMYNAIMDFANNLEIPAQLYRSAWAKYLGG